MKLGLVMVIVACGGATDPPPPTATTTPPPAPIVDNAAVLSRDDGTPPLVVLIDASGRRMQATTTSWSDLAIGKYTADPQPLARPKLTPPPRAEDDDDEWEEDHGIAGIDYPVQIEEGRLGKPKPPKSNRIGAHALVETSDPWLLRQTQITGEVVTTALDQQPAVIVAAPTARASTLVDAIVDTEGMIGVAHRGAIRRLRFQFVRVRGADTDSWPRVWFEVRHVGAGVEIEAVPDEPIVVAGGGKDPGFATALAKVMARAPRVVALDVLVAPDTDVQRFVDVLVALDAAGVRTVGLGVAPAPGSEAAKRRGRPRGKHVTFGRPSISGDLDKAVIRALVLAQRDAFSACSESMRGTRIKVEAKFFVRPDRTIDPDMKTDAPRGAEPLVTCVNKVISKLEFPKWRGGGGLSVSYPLTFRQ